MNQRQPSLFDTPAELPSPRPRNIALVRKHLLATLRMVREAEIMPWHKADAIYWESNFPVLSRLLPEAESEPLLAEFEKEMTRLKAAR